MTRMIVTHNAAINLTATKGGSHVGKKG
uniref:Uncharacterized protein n=1 Tax=Ciona intestinalis TaxID=7719 RepID=H2XVT9_CIOIN